MWSKSIQLKNERRAFEMVDKLQLTRLDQALAKYEIQ